MALSVCAGSQGNGDTGFLDRTRKSPGAPMRKYSISVWPQPREMQLETQRLTLTSPLHVRTHGQAPWLAQAAHQTAEALNRAAAGRATVMDANGGTATLTVATMEKLPPGLEPVRHAEGYVLAITSEGVWLAGQEARGVFYGAQTLAQLL